MFKELIVPITGAAGDNDTVEAAIEMAIRQEAHLVILDSFNLPMPTLGPWGLNSEGDITRLYDDLRAHASNSAQRWRTRLQRETISSEVRLAESMLVAAQQTSAIHARYADLAVITGPGDNRDEAILAHSYFSALLMESGRPVLVVPPGCTVNWPPRHAIMAWRPTREATRALHDSLPVLRAATSVEVVSVDPVRGGESTDDGDQPGADIAAHLARHDLQVRVDVLDSDGQGVAATLLAHADATGADLLIAGGYGHSKLREWILGGTTRELFMQARIPVLFSR